MILPSVSVLVLNYEYQRFLAECIQSVIDQERRPAEIIVVDDASPSGIGSVKAIVEPFMEKANARGIDLSLHVQDKNVGTCENLRTGHSMVKGDYVMNLDADNYLDPNYLSRTARVLDGNPNVGVVYTDAVAFGPLADERSRASTWWRNRKVIVAKHRPDWYVWEFFGFDFQHELREALAQRNFMHGSSLFRRCVTYPTAPGGRANCYARVRDLPRAEDWDFWKQVVLNGWDAAYVREPLLYYRQHDGAQRNVPKA